MAVVEELEFLTEHEARELAGDQMFDRFVRDRLVFAFTKDFNGPRYRRDIIEMRLDEERCITGVVQKSYGKSARESVPSHMEKSALDLSNRITKFANSMGTAHVEDEALALSNRLLRLIAAVGM